LVADFVGVDQNDSEKELMLDRFSEVLDQSSSGQDVITDQVFNFNESIMVPGKSVLVLECK
jgi:hypothetical protein